MVEPQFLYAPPPLPKEKQFLEMIKDVFQWLGKILMPLILIIGIIIGISLWYKKSKKSPKQKQVILIILVIIMIFIGVLFFI